MHDHHDPDDEAPIDAAPSPPRRKMWTSVVFALVATLAVVGMLLIHVWSRYRVLKLGYEVSELSREHEQLQEEHRRLRIETQVLTRTDRLEPIARRQLVLAPPRPEQILYVPASKLPLPPLLAPSASSRPMARRAPAAPQPVGAIQ